MSKNLLITLLISTIFINNTYADTASAKELFNEAKCLSCHGFDQFKVREDKVNSFRKLHEVVDKCSYNTNTGWFEDETGDVVLYLNQDFYHFKNLD